MRLLFPKKESQHLFFLFFVFFFLVLNKETVNYSEMSNLLFNFYCFMQGDNDELNPKKKL